MASGRDATKRERIEVFLGRLDAAPVASDADEAYRQVCDILNAVEDELTSIPFDPTQWMTDGRMYPPQRGQCPGRARVLRRDPLSKRGAQHVPWCQWGDRDPEHRRGCLAVQARGGWCDDRIWKGGPAMNQVERLRDDLTRRFPILTVSLDAPADESRGSWFLDVQRDADLPPIVVEWRPDRGFGVSTPEEFDYGVGVNEIYPNIKAAFERVAQLVLSGGKTAPPLIVRLAELRQSRGLSQAELAEQIGVKQANVSRIEGRGDDIRVDTLARIVAAMGGTLAILARFPDGTEREIRLGT